MKAGNAPQVRRIYLLGDCLGPPFAMGEGTLGPTPLASWFGNWVTGDVVTQRTAAHLRLHVKRAPRSRVLGWMRFTACMGSVILSGGLRDGPCSVVPKGRRPCMRFGRDRLLRRREISLAWCPWIPVEDSPGQIGCCPMPAAAKRRLKIWRKRLRTCWRSSIRLGAPVAARSRVGGGRSGDASPGRANAFGRASGVGLKAGPSGRLPFLFVSHRN